MIDRKNIPSDVIDKAQRQQASKKYIDNIYKLYYSDFEIKPFISQDRELYTNWEEQAIMFPSSSIISKKTLTKFDDGLLPGHVYMLHWIANVHRKRIPSYFEYKYGINFTDELNFLFKEGFIDQEHNVTSKGYNAIKKHFDIIENHNNKQALNNSKEKSNENVTSSVPNKSFISKIKKFFN